MKHYTALLLIFFTIGCINAQEEQGISFKNNNLIISEVPPTWPDCSGDINAKKKCFSKKLSEHLQKTFKYPAGYTSPNYREKVIVTFFVTKQGTPHILNAVGGTTALQDEAIKTIMAMPEVKPATRLNKPIDMKYTIPFTL